MRTTCVNSKGSREGSSPVSCARRRALSQALRPLAPTLSNHSDSIPCRPVQFSALLSYNSSSLDSLLRAQKVERAIHRPSQRDLSSFPSSRLLLSSGFDLCRLLLVQEDFWMPVARTRAAVYPSAVLHRRQDLPTGSSSDSNGEWAFLRVGRAGKGLSRGG